VLLQLLTFALLTVSPLGGMVAAIPLGLLAFGLPVWLVALLGVALTYLQVVAVDVAWSALCRRAWWRGMLARRRAAWLERLLGSPGAFWPTVALTPLVGCWVVMGLARYAGVPQRQVAAPILLGLCLLAAVMCSACLLLPHLFGGMPELAAAAATATTATTATTSATVPAGP
jgi:hypothetical protein